MTLTRAHASAQLTGAGLSPRRALGQNFVVDPNTVRKIARLAGVQSGDHVVEIGAGLGSLTLALADCGADITAIEVDSSIVPLLSQNVAHLPNVRVVEGDATKIDWSTLLKENDTWRLVANLPYNVATPLVADVLDEVPQVTHLFVMVQREVGERFAARPRTEAYGAVSVKVAYWGRAEVVGIVPPTVFLPRPKIDSALVSITRHAQPIATDVNEREFFALVKQGFAKRRKMLRGALAGTVDTQHFSSAEINPTARAEELDVHDWIRLYRAVKATS